MHPKNIAIADYTYVLPEEKIAAFPLPHRDASKLLVYKNQQLTQDTYQNIAAHLPNDSLLVFNNTKVIQARILFQKPSGGVIEIFCLEPFEAVNEYSTIMATKATLRWKCLVGGAAKWKEEFLVKKINTPAGEIELKAKLIEKLADAYLIELQWQPAEWSFAEVLAQMGDIPLPPYIKRKSQDSDKARYQTIYAAQDGSVAAPTAGLHFTDTVFETLQAKNISTAFVTLHVGAGTFKPVKAEAMAQHHMHAEWMDLSRPTIELLLQHIQGHITAVGTTSLRSVESLYWMGVKAHLQPDATIEQLTIHQWEVYEEPLLSNQIAPRAAIASLLQWMDTHHCERIIAATQILIAPGYRFKMAKAIVTNFHQPQSTLLLLVAAAIGEQWRINYDYALANDFRFLSYGDGSLLYIDKAAAG